MEGREEGGWKGGRVMEGKEDGREGRGMEGMEGRW